ncbi:McrB family protein [Bartonella sp. HY038]|uniref:McrB family protein n=1 Tax=Bartonella sp. HY038 TaxID=2759660 RepID=UPI0015FA687B|nr:AAA family ATPase [Bartonella sp. HY038]
MNIDILHKLFAKYTKKRAAAPTIKWKSDYSHTYERVKEYKEKLQNRYNLTVENDKDFLSELLKDDRNGVSTNGQSNITNDAFEYLINDTKFITIVQNLILNPNLDNYNALQQHGKSLLNEIKKSNAPLLFNRACASCTLDVSSVVHEEKLTKLVNFLIEKQIIEFPKDINQENWFEKNIYLVEKVRDAFADEIKNNAIDMFDINIFIWDIYEKEVSEICSVEEAIEYLDKRYPGTRDGTQYIKVYNTNNGKELALNSNQNKVTIYCDTFPPVVLNLTIKRHYAATETRNSNLNSRAKTLAEGKEAYLLSINSLEELEIFCDWYEGKLEIIQSPDVSLKNKNTDKSKLNQPLNRILYGAAGTGKTYHTINHALSIIENVTLDALNDENRETLKHRFDQYKEQGLIKFVTFHQSFSYEDFVEGIRAETNALGQLTYNIKSGIFKEICDLNIQDGLMLFQVATEFGDYTLNKITKELLEIEKPNGNIIHLSRDLINILLNAYRENKITANDFSEKQVIDKLGKNILLEPYLINGYNSILARLIPFLSEYLDAHSSKKQNYVLIIDEINRGNISRIFGELITLIEDTKRQGSEEELSVTLPYSKQEFFVPKNVYLIGTMNLSDRSLTGLDIALRRRFTFIEMPPKPELLKDVKIGNLNIGDLLDIMNKRIEVLLDRDHCIGHANFLSLKTTPSVEDLALIFKHKIIPQLQEYFFDDWSKINMVLNANGMLKQKDIEHAQLFSNIDIENGSFIEEQTIWEIDDRALQSIEAFSKILNS